MPEPPRIAIAVGPGRPAYAEVAVECPSCGQLASILASITGRLTRDTDGTGQLAIRTRASKAAHLCGQLPLELPDDDAPTPIRRRSVRRRLP